MHILLGLAIVPMLVHGFNSIVLTLLAEIKSGVKYWRETAKK
jgi:hypothetical protein